MNEEQIMILLSIIEERILLNQKDILQYETTFSEAPRNNEMVQHLNEEISMLEEIKEIVPSFKTAKRVKRSQGIIENLDIDLRNKVDEMLRDSKHYTYKDIRQFLQDNNVKASQMAISTYVKKYFS